MNLQSEMKLGKNITDACVESKVEYFIWST